MLSGANLTRFQLHEDRRLGDVSMKKKKIGKLGPGY